MTIEWIGGLTLQPQITDEEALDRIGKILDPGESDPDRMAEMLREISEIQRKATDNHRGDA